jgi:hypothetical protein
MPGACGQTTLGQTCIPCSESQITLSIFFIDLKHDKKKYENKALTKQLNGSYSFSKKYNNIRDCSS